MNIFMLGWEFPPFISGGLGTACYGLTKAMSELGHHVVFVLPQAVSTQYASHVRLKTPTPIALAGGGYSAYALEELENVEFRGIPSTLQAYAHPAVDAADAKSSTSSAQGEGVVSVDGGPSTAAQRSFSILTEAMRLSAGQYGGDMLAEVYRYARIATALARYEQFDVVHAHDWMTYPAGISVSAASGRPLVIHVHSTEFDRSGEHVNQRIYDIERQGMHAAHKVICVSHLTRNIVISRYGVPPDKVEVVYNAIENNGPSAPPPPRIERNEKIVLFLGRITMQKGPEYFLAAAKKVLEHMQDVRFVMAGSGDMIRQSIEMAAHMGIGHKVVFTGFLRGDDVARVFKMADLYVMPSVSEPFGIAPLEALSNEVPVLISKQSGVSEVLAHVLKVDFWDIDEMANKILAVLRHPPLQTTLREHGSFEIKKLTWRDSAQNCVGVYGGAISAAHAHCVHA